MNKLKNILHYDLHKYDTRLLLSQMEIPYQLSRTGEERIWYALASVYEGEKNLMHLFLYSFYLCTLSFQLTRCLVQILSKVLYKTDDNPVHPECKNILTPGTLLLGTVRIVLLQCVFEVKEHWFIIGLKGDFLWKVILPLQCLQSELTFTFIKNIIWTYNVKTVRLHYRHKF